MNNIAFNLFNRSAKKYLKKNRRNRKFIDYHKAKSIVLLFEYTSNHDIDTIKEIISPLMEDGKQVKAIGYRNEKDEAQLTHDNIQIFTKKNTNIFGKPQKDILKELEADNSDILIDLSLNKSLPLLYTALYSDTSFRVGTHIVEPAVYDFILDIQKIITQPTPSLLFDEIIFYLKSIKSSD